MLRPKAALPAMLRPKAALPAMLRPEAAGGEQARVIAMKKLERVAPEGKFLLSHKHHEDYISGAVHGAAGAGSDATAEGRRRA